MDLEEFKKEIATAFGDLSVPNKPLVNHVCDECLNLQTAFEGKSWRDVSFDLIQEHFADLSLFSPNAFHAFVPAYLIHSIGNLDDDDCVSEFAAYAFLPDRTAVTSEELGNWWKLKLSLFSDDQFYVILKYLDLVEQTDEGFDRSLMKRGRERLITLRGLTEIKS